MSLVKPAFYHSLRNEVPASSIDQSLLAVLDSTADDRSDDEISMLGIAIDD